MNKLSRDEYRRVFHDLRNECGKNIDLSGDMIIFVGVLNPFDDVLVRIVLAYWLQENI